jgi:hypothetical protein
MFPELANVSSDRVRFSVIVATVKVRISDSLWPIVVSALPTETIVDVEILPEPSEEDKQPPSYHTLASSGAGKLSGEKDYILIFSLAGENQAAFVRPGKTFDVRPLHPHYPYRLHLSSDYSTFHSL